MRVVIIRGAELVKFFFFFSWIGSNIFLELLSGNAAQYRCAVPSLDCY